MEKRSNDTGPRCLRETEGRPATSAPPCEAPRSIKKRSVARVTLFSGGGPMAGGRVATGG